MFVPFIRRHRINASIAIFGALLSLALALPLVTPRQSAADTSGLSIIYLTNAAQSPLDRQALQRQGVRIVTAADVLRSLSADTGAIMIDAALLPGVDRAWLGEQHRAGKYIIGINVPMDTLAPAVQFQPLKSASAGYSPQTSNITQGYLSDYDGLAYFSAIFSVTTPAGARHQGTLSYPIYSTEDFLGLINQQLDSVWRLRTESPAPNALPLPPHP